MPSFRLRAAAVGFSNVILTIRVRMFWTDSCVVAMIEILRSLSSASAGAIFRNKDFLCGLFLPGYIPSRR